MRYGNEDTWAGQRMLPQASVINAALSYAGGMIVCAALIGLCIDQAARLSASLLAPTLSASNTNAKPALRGVKVSGASNAAIIAEMEARHAPRTAKTADHSQPDAAAPRHKKVLVKLARR